MFAQQALYPWKHCPSPSKVGFEVLCMDTGHRMGPTHRSFTWQEAACPFDSRGSLSRRQRGQEGAWEGNEPAGVLTLQRSDRASSCRPAALRGHERAVPSGEDSKPGR